jgi:hypothetical protein
MQQLGPPPTADMGQIRLPGIVLTPVRRTSAVPRIADHLNAVAPTVSVVPADEIAIAIAAARGALMIALRLGRASIAERPESRRYDGSTHIFFDG